MAVRRTRAELASLREARIPDNPLHAITPAAVRAQLADMDTSALNLADDGLPTGTPGAAAYAALTGQPTDSAPLAAALRRGPNQAPAAPVHLVRYLRNTDRPAGEPTAPTLDTLLLADVLGLKHEVIIIDNRAGQPERVRVMFNDPGFACWRDGDNQDRSTGELVDVASPRAQAQPYAFYGPTYAFTEGDLVRSFPSDNPSTERFFSAASNGTRPAPTLEAGDTNWVRVDETRLPNSLRPAWENIVGDPRDNPDLVAYVDGAVAGINSPWRYIGDPARDNVSRGPLHSSNAISPSSDSNTLGFGVKRITLYTQAEGVKVGEYSSDIVVGDVATQNAGTTYDIVFGYISRDITVGKGSQHIEFKNLCRYVDMGPNCLRVLVDNCQGSVGAPFVIPAGTTDAVYRNNVLVTASGITPADVLGLIDLAASSLNGVDVAISSTTGKLVFTAHL